MSASDSDSGTADDTTIPAYPFNNRPRSISCPTRAASGSHRRYRRRSRPCFFWATRPGTTFQFHLASWLDVAGQWRKVSSFRAGLNGPTGASASRALFFILRPRGYWARRWVPCFRGEWRRGRSSGSRWCFPASPCGGLRANRFRGMQAVAAALIFMVNPYHLMVVYYRSDFAELLASALFPLAGLGICASFATALGRVREEFHLVASCLRGSGLRTRPPL